MLLVLPLSFIFSNIILPLSPSGAVGSPLQPTHVCKGIQRRNEWRCSQDKNSTLSIQACLNIETLFDRVAATRGMQYS